MPTWILEPRDPLIARDGRPFNAEAGARARSLPMPPPSVMAGAWRSRRGRGADGTFDGARIAELRREAVMGPLLVSLDAGGAIAEYAAPAPQDAVFFGDDALERHRLVPRAAAGLTDMPAGLALLGFEGEAPTGKPSATQPAYWRWSAFERWLVQPTADWPSDGALAGPEAESRTHVAVSGQTRTAEDGALFSTEGRRFQSKTARLALALNVAADDGVIAGLAPVGGERRLASWRPAGAPWPSVPDGLVEAIVARRACRLVLLTPAFFANGWRPGGGLSRDGVTVTLRAAAVGRPDVLSGWDLERGRPKPARRAARAGAVYFLSLDGSPEAIAAWVRATWMRCVSDDAQDALDGFGLAALGMWEGTIDA